MNYVITNGLSYIMKNPNGKFVQTYSVDTASSYKTKTKAQNAWNCLPRIYKEGGFEVQEMKTLSDVTRETKQELVKKTLEGDLNNAISFEIKDSEWLAAFKNDLMTVGRTIGNLKQRYAEIYEQLTNVTAQIDDIEHAIEFLNPNAAKGYYLETELRKARRKRREYKDAIDLIETVSKFSVEDWSSDKLSKKIDWLSSRSYVPKVRVDLFK